MRKGCVALCVIVVVLSSLTGTAVAGADYQSNEGQSASGSDNARLLTQPTSQSATDRKVNGFNQTSADVDTESNYDQSNASVINDGEYTSLVIEDGDVDYYAVELAENEELAASIKHDDSAGDLEISIEDEDSNGNSITSSRTDDGTESVGFGWDTEGTYYIRVEAENGVDTDIEYDLLIETGDNATASYGERFEPNYEQDIATQLDDGEYTSLVIEDGDVDYYAVELAENEELAASIKHDDSAGDLEISIEDEDSNGNSITSSRTDDGTESVGFGWDTEGTYYIRVEAENGVDTDIEYDLLIETGDNATASYGERFEPNYEQDIATQLDDGEYTSLVIEDGDTDYYAVELAENEELAASIKHDDSAGDLEISIEDEDSNGNSITSGRTDDGTESVGFGWDTKGTYYIRVEAENGVDTDIEYDLLIETGDNATASYGERFEPNYEQDIATQLDDGEYLSLISDEDDLDYYAVDVSDNEELGVAVEYNSTGGELELSIEDTDGNDLNSSSTDGGAGYTTADVGTDDIYYIVVENTDESEVQYNLSINPSVPTLTPTATPTATTEAPTTASPQETTATDQPPVTQTQTRLPTESQIEETPEGATTDEPDDGVPETISSGSGPGFTGSITVGALLISVYIGIRRL